MDPSGGDRPGAEVIDLLDVEDDSLDEEEDENRKHDDDDDDETTTKTVAAAAASVVVNPYRKRPSPKQDDDDEEEKEEDGSNKKKKQRKCPVVTSNRKAAPRALLQAGLVLEDDIASNHHPSTAAGASSSSSSMIDMAQAYTQQQELRKARGERPRLYHDVDFATVPASIEGPKKSGEAIVVKCRCRGSQAARLSFKAPKKQLLLQQQQQGGLPPPPQQQQLQRPYYHCAQNRCNYFKWAFQAESMPWYRFGAHTGHCMVGPEGFAARDLTQGRVGDCWFLSALAVVAERPDLIARLFGEGKFVPLNEYGMVQVNLFLDGYWKTVTMDNFLPCIVDAAAEGELQRALEVSLGGGGGQARAWAEDGGTATATSSDYNPHALTDDNRRVLQETHEFLQQQQSRTTGVVARQHGFHQQPPMILQRPVTSQDLAYSVAKKQQLWVPFLEKAYAKSHGSYQAISGGHIAEAFLDLTGAPTQVYQFDSKSFEPRRFWHKLLQYRRQRLPMGCGTSSSAAGIIGRHAYSILDVREVKNVGFRFFHETGVAHGNVSGFTEYDGTVRLLRIRNPHGKGEWKGEFSDRSGIWEKLLQHQEPGGLGGGGFDDNDGATPALHRTMKDDGIFWIDYDSFLMGFSHVDVVLAFVGNHAKSFTSNFPAKKSNHRCARAFEVALLDAQPGVPSRDTVELFIMGIQKNRRGARHGRADRKVSYKLSDIGMIVGENYNDDTGDASDDSGGDGGDSSFTTVKGQLFGFTKHRHYRLILDRKKNTNEVVMPISFGNPAATDSEQSFVVRFVSDAPVYIRERVDVPRLDLALQKFCLSQHGPSRKQGKQRILLADPVYRLVQIDCLDSGAGTVFLYLCINSDELRKGGHSEAGVSFSVKATCRGISCRTEDGLLKHETVAKMQKFEAAWRRFAADFVGERKSRLLMVFFQSGVDYEFGSIDCKQIPTPRKLGSAASRQVGTLDGFLGREPESSAAREYSERGIFNAVEGNEAFELVENMKSSVDEEHERALALTRGDLEIQQVLELSKQQTAADSDAALQRALALSLANTGGAATNEDQNLQRAIEESKSLAHGKPQSTTYDEDLQQAILLSKKESRPSRDEIVDLT